MKKETEVITNAIRKLSYALKVMEKIGTPNECDRIRKNIMKLNDALTKLI
jgi:hypothetical protein